MSKRLVLHRSDVVQGDRRHLYDCGTVSRAVASNFRDTWFESGPRQFFSTNQCMCIKLNRKDPIKLSRSASLKKTTFNRHKQNECVSKANEGM